jgi:phosphoribosylformimino-5-aminoimidazole carboxamide ribotide isomerase
VELYPAVDIRGGRVAHVRVGNASHPSVYGDDPAAAVLRLAAAGARWVHLVDLDRAHGRLEPRARCAPCLVPHHCITQVGGSLGTEAIDEMLAWGAARVVVGCAAAATEPSLVGRLVRRHGADRLAVGIDASGGRVTPRGAGTVPGMPTELLARRIIEQGGRLAVYTDVTRDGTLAGPDTVGAQHLATLGLEVIASGGVGSPLRTSAPARPLAGVIGRALHEGRLLAEALAARPRDARICAAGCRARRAVVVALQSVRLPSGGDDHAAAHCCSTPAQHAWDQRPVARRPG